MNTAGIEEYIRQRKNGVDMNLMLKGWKDEESGFFFLYSPSLDITGYGDTEQMARNSFEITLKEFLDYTFKKKTLFAELDHLGWYINHSKKKGKGPELDKMAKENTTLRDLLKNKNVRSYNRNINMQIA